MASALTSTGLKSSQIYFAFILLVIVGVIYLLLIKKPSAADNIVRQAFQLNSSAFENGIYFANIRFLTKNPDRNQLDQWLIGKVGLDYNQKGFPIGTDIEDFDQQTPKTSENCRQIWQFILGPLQPKLHLSKKNSGYWTYLNEQNVCIYQRDRLNKMILSYHSETGRVYLTK